MNVLGAIILVLIVAMIIWHMCRMKLDTNDQILAYYFLLVGLTDIYLNHIHNRFFNVS